MNKIYGLRDLPIDHSLIGTTHEMNYIHTTYVNELLKVRTGKALYRFVRRWSALWRLRIPNRPAPAAFGRFNARKVLRAIRKFRIEGDKFDFSCRHTRVAADIALPPVLVHVSIIAYKFQAPEDPILCQLFGPEFL